MDKPFMTIQQRLNFGLGLHLASVYIYLCIFSKLQGSIFGSAYSSRAYLDRNKGKSHDLCGNVFVSNQMDLNDSMDLAGTKHNQLLKNCA